MIITGIELANFRNYRRQTLEFVDGGNHIAGRNAQGKSNLLEAIYFLSHMRSPRASRLRDVVKEDEDEASVKGTIIDGDERFSLRVMMGRQGRTVEMNGRKLQKTTSARGRFKCVLFSPDDLSIVKGEPSVRRAFMEETMEELDPCLAAMGSEYRHLLGQRNAVLRDWERHGSGLATVLRPWSEALSRTGGKITAERKRMVDWMGPMVEEQYQEIAGKNEQVKLEYRSRTTASGDEEKCATGLLRALLRSAEEERRARATVVGPHRDDVRITISGHEARNMASQGEQRSVAICVRIAQMAYIEERTGKTPVLLLDDVLSELDRDRRAKVVEAAGERCQVFITSTEEPRQGAKGAGKVFRVSNGEVEVVRT